MFVTAFSTREKAVEWIDEAERVATEAGWPDHLYSVNPVTLDALTPENSLYVFVAIDVAGEARSGFSQWPSGAYYDGKEWLGYGKTWKDAYNMAEDQRLEFLADKEGWAPKL